MEQWSASSCNQMEPTSHALSWKLVLLGCVLLVPGRVEQGSCHCQDLTLVSLYLKLILQAWCNLVHLLGCQLWYLLINMAFK